MHIYCALCFAVNSTVRDIDSMRLRQLGLNKSARWYQVSLLNTKGSKSERITVVVNRNDDNNNNIFLQ